MSNDLQPRWARSTIAAIAIVAFGAIGAAPLGACDNTDGVSHPPPLTQVSAADVDGNVTLMGEAEPEVLVFGVNEDRGVGDIVTSDINGDFTLVIEGATGENIAVWQRIGSVDSAPRFVTVP